MTSETQGMLVAHFKDGQIAKGFSRDFDPAGEYFHMVRRDGEVATSQQIRLDDLKALFHVKSWGRADRHRGRQPGFPEDGSTMKPEGTEAIKTMVEFYDGERIFGYSLDYDPGRRGFYVLPADPEDNNHKIFVLNSALVNIQIFRE